MHSETGSTTDSASDDLVDMVQQAYPALWFACHIARREGLSFIVCVPCSMPCRTTSGSARSTGCVRLPTLRDG